MRNFAQCEGGSDGNFLGDFEKGVFFVVFELLSSLFILFFFLSILYLYYSITVITGN